MNILLVGAGAVGQVYGLHLQRGGARVAFLVRLPAAAACEAGLTLHPRKRRGDRAKVTFRPDAVLTALAEVAAQTWDQVWLCVPATALEDGWLRSIAAAVGDAVIVALPPGLESERRIRAAFPGDRVVSAMIGLISYQAPLPGENVDPPGVAYLFPPGSPTGFDGPHAADVAAALSRGGCPAVVKPGIAKGSAFGSGLLMPNVAALEAAGWSLAELRRGPWLPLAAAAVRQAMTVTAAQLGVRAPLFRALIRGFTLRLVWWLAPRVLPLDLEAYLRYHFTKVGGQTRQLLAEYRVAGDARGLPTAALADLSTRLLALDGAVTVGGR